MSSKPNKSKKLCSEYLNRVFEDARIDPANRRHAPEIGFAMALAWLAGYTDAEIATAYGTSVHAVSMRRWRALHRLDRAPGWFPTLAKRLGLDHILHRYAERRRR